MVTAVLGTWIGGCISDQNADRQRELELDATLISAISRDSVTLFQDAQEVSRATGDSIKQRVQRDRAADAWYQKALYDWAVLACCTTESGRERIVHSIREYLKKYVGLSDRPVMKRRWAALKAGPATKTYQWLGRKLLRGRGALLRDMKTSSPDLD